MRKLSLFLRTDGSSQTAYIPPRIWHYQVGRLKEVIDDFNSLQPQIISCFRECLEIYKATYGSLSAACALGKTKPAPFWKNAKGNFTFSSIAKKHGILDLLLKWTNDIDKSSERAAFPITKLSTYFTMVSHAGIAYILNFTLMRVNEALTLRSDCLHIEHDAYFGRMYMLKGITSKTIADEKAFWPTSPSVEGPINALKAIASLRMECMSASSGSNFKKEEKENPFLLCRPYEPWGAISKDDAKRPPTVRMMMRAYRQFDVYEKLFNINELKITQADLDVARSITPSLDPESYDVGKVWPLAWHQLRRTGAVNMQSSSLVSTRSLQYAMKHTSRTMSLYYGQGYSSLNIDPESRGLYIKAMYEGMGRDLLQLSRENYFSPHGSKRKDAILNMMLSSDFESLTTLGEKSHISWRETLLGGCTKRGPCPYGGHDNLVNCTGLNKYQPCADVLYDSKKISSLKELKRRAANSFSRLHYTVTIHERPSISN